MKVIFGRSPLGESPASRGSRLHWLLPLGLAPPSLSAQVMGRFQTPAPLHQLTQPFVFLGLMSADQTESRQHGKDNKAVKTRRGGGSSGRVGRPSSAVQSGEQVVRSKSTCLFMFGHLHEGGGSLMNNVQCAVFNWGRNGFCFVLISNFIITSNVYLHVCK